MGFAEHLPQHHDDLPTPILRSSNWSRGRRGDLTIEQLKLPIWGQCRHQVGKRIRL
jgi:hypothetical protein